MKIIKTTDGSWVIEPQTREEQKRLEWLIECLKSHPDQQAVETGREQQERLGAVYSRTGS
jgi:hypothetical protein